VLPAGPLANKQTVSIMIQNNSANPLKLSEPTVDTKGVEVQLAEPNPGRSFTATLNFPQGFEMAQGARAEFSVKSDNPRHILIKVPITQMPKPVAPVAVPVPHPTIVPLSPPPPAPATPPASASASKPAAQ
jgi:hypothetical protein